MISLRTYQFRGCDVAGGLCKYQIDKSWAVYFVTPMKILNRERQNASVGYNFEWDPKKAEANLSKRGVQFREAVTTFGDPLSMNMADPDHSEAEERFIVLGMSDRYRLLVVSDSERPPSTQVISARLATRHEQRQYEEK